MLVAAHRALGTTLWSLGSVASAYMHFAQGIALYDPQQHRASAFLYGEDAGVICHILAARALWYLGYPDQALARSQEAVALAQQIAHPFSLSFVLSFAAMFHQFRREERWTQERAEAAITLATTQDFPFWMALVQFYVAGRWRNKDRRRKGSSRCTRACKPFVLQEERYCAILSGAPRRRTQCYRAARGRTDGAHGSANACRDHWRMLVRIRTVSPQRRTLLQQNSDSHAEAEACFQHAIRIAQNQQAKSWELRAATSLARLWQQQGKPDEARQVLAEVYNWFTEGFDTADWQDAKALLNELGA